MSQIKILVFSDTHKDTNACIDIIQNTKGVNAIIHAGDLVGDAEDLAHIFSDIPFYYVSGNNDIFSREPLDKLIDLGGKKIFITHGHTHNVRYEMRSLAMHAKKLGAQLAVFGHTHRACDMYENGMHLINPGSMGYYPKTYAVILIKDGEIKTRIVNYD